MDVHISRLHQTLEATVQEASEILVWSSKSPMDLASIADIDCILVRNSHGAGYSR